MGSCWYCGQSRWVLRELDWPATVPFLLEGVRVVQSISGDARRDGWPIDMCTCRAEVMFEIEAAAAI